MPAANVRLCGVGSRYLRGSGRGLRVLAGGKRRAIAWLTPSTGCQGCLDVWASAVVLGSHSNHVGAPSLRLREAWFEIESGVWGCKRAVYIGQVCRRLPPMYPVMQRRWRYSRSSWVEREPRPSQPRMRTSAKLWCQACVRGLGASESSVKRDKV